MAQPIVAPVTNGAVPLSDTTRVIETPYHATPASPAGAVAPATTAVGSDVHTATSRPIEPTAPVVHPTPPTNVVTEPTTPARPEKHAKPAKEKPVKLIDAREAAHKRNKLLLWLLWLVIMLVSAAFVAIALATFGNLQDVYHNRGNTLGSRQLWGALTATILTPVLVIVYFALGTFVLLKKTVSETGLTYMYGVLNASALWLAALMLLSAVTMNSYNNAAHNEWEANPVYKWSSSDASLFHATYILSYILVCLYFILFLGFIALQGGTKHLNLDSSQPMQQVKVI